jgi:hypothetical protein
MKTADSALLEGEPPAGYVDMPTMLEYFFAHEPSRPSAFKVKTSCRDDGMPHLRWGARYYFNLREVAEYFESRKRPALTVRKRGGGVRK